MRFTRDGKIYKQRYERGNVVYTAKSDRQLSADKTRYEGYLSCRIETIFEETVYDYDVLKARDFARWHFLTKGLKIIFEDEREEPGTEKDIPL